MRDQTKSASAEYDACNRAKPNAKHGCGNWRPKLFFKLERQGSRFALSRDVDVSQPVRRDGLTIDEVEDLLNTWKLRGPHGG